MSTEITETKSEKLLSIIFCGRTGYFAGNYLWRMSIILNKLAENIEALDVTRDVEIIVADWGGDKPLLHDLELTEPAKLLVKFLVIPPSIASAYDQKIGFSKVHAINCAVRRAAGTHILVCDFDTYITLDTMASLLWHVRRGYVHAYTFDNSFFWASKFFVPNDFFSKKPETRTLPTLPIDPAFNISIEFITNTPQQEHLDEFIQSHWTTLEHEAISIEREYKGSGSAMLISRAIWFESTGLDERFVGEAWNDVDFTQRLMQKYRWADLEDHGMNFYVLGHNPEHQKAVSECKTNHGSHLESNRFAPNPPDWGLANQQLNYLDGYGLPIKPARGVSESLTLTKFDTSKLPQSVRQIISNNILYHHATERFGYLPLTWFTNQEPLKALLSILQPQFICEIGTWMGASAIFFAGFPYVKQIVCVDHWNRNRVEGYEPDVAPQKLWNNSYEQFLANAVYSGTDDKICPIRLDSNAAVKYCMEKELRFDLIYVDGDHTTVGARADILKWSSLLGVGGYMCGDDWGWQKEPDNVAGAVVSVAKEKGWQVLYYGNFWLTIPGEFSVQQLTIEQLQKIRPIQPATFSRNASATCEMESDSKYKHIKNTQPMISIFTICKNSAEFIRRCLDSILAIQHEYDNIEYLIQDGASTDATLDIIAEYAPRFGNKLKLFSEPDSGPEEAIWRVLKKCQGDIICSCLADEQLVPDALSLAVETFSTHPKAAAIFGRVCTTDENGVQLEIDKGPSDFDIAGYVCGEFTPHFAASFFRKSCLEEVGLYTRNWKYSLGEFEIWTRLGMRYPIVPVPAVLSQYARHSGSKSGSIKNIARITAGRLELLKELFHEAETPEQFKKLQARAFAGQYVHAAWHYLAFEINSPEEARKAILEALKYQPHPEHHLYTSFVNKLYAYGFELCDKGEFERALEYLNLVDNTGIYATKIYYHIALALSALGRYSEARKALEKELSNNSNPDVVALMQFIDSKFDTSALSKYELLLKDKAEMLEQIVSGRNIP